jgi:L-ascorbate metabolism protein UlaG (beta-lactamase superfamily)
MRIRRLGWAGIEIEHEGATIVIDAIRDVGGAREVVGPLRVDVVPPRAAGRVRAALVTHLHTDHADPGAIADALAPDGVVLRPHPDGGAGPLEAAALAEAEQGLAALAQPVVALAPWERREIGPLTVTALPAVDGFGDPQVGWHVAGGDASLVHCGDTLLHGWWWSIVERLGAPDVALLPVNGAVIALPHRQPASTRPAVMTPEDAVVAARALRSTLVPIHDVGLDAPPRYVPIADPTARAVAAAEAAGVPIHVLGTGEELALDDVRQRVPATR